MIGAAVASALSQLSGSKNESDREEKNNPAQASSPNSNRKLRLKIIPNKPKEVFLTIT